MSIKQNMKRQFETPERIISKKKCPSAPPRKRMKIQRETGVQAFVCPSPIRSPTITNEEEDEILRESPRVVRLNFLQTSNKSGELTPCFQDGEYSDDE